MKNEHDTVTAELPVSGTPETSRPEGLTLVQMYQINVKPQVRTETGWSDAELDELGESIMREGLLQLPLLRRDPESNTLIPVAGHRRIEAMKRKGFSEFYAIVGDADEAKAFRMQLAENIQREQLSTREVANAVRKLADEGNTPTQIGEIVKKSKAWVSKHLSLTHPEFGKYARSLFERGTVEDLEILGSLSQAEKAANEKGYVGEQWTCAQYPGNPWTRKDAAAVAKRAKSMKHADEQQTDNDDGQGEADPWGTNETAESAEEDAYKMKCMNAAERIQEAMVTAISSIKDGQKMTADYALAYIIDFACGDEANKLNGTREALMGMLKQ
jgi:ParB/RepB/Spo0J family partition protein